MTKQKIFLSTLILAMFLTACSNSEQKPATQNNPTTQPSQEIKTPSATGATDDNPNVVKAEGGVAIIPPNPPAATPQASPATPAIADAGKAPKIDLPTRKVDFGKVAPGKNMTRDIVVKNVGKAVLNIESVTPS